MASDSEKIMQDLPHCARCGVPRVDKACVTPGGHGPEHLCPMTVAPESIERGTAGLAQGDDLELARQASLQEASCYADRHRRPFVKLPVKPRIQETWELAHRLGIGRVGLAFCAGLAGEALQVTRLLEGHGLEVVSAVCKVGCVPKERLGLADTDKIRAGGHESMCHPVAQVRVLEDAGAQLLVLLGLCVGHDALFFRHATVPCTVLAVKDRVTGHNPLAAVYTAGSYFDRLTPPGR